VTFYYSWLIPQVLHLQLLFKALGPYIDLHHSHTSPESSSPRVSYHDDIERTSLRSYDSEDERLQSAAALESAYDPPDNVQQSTSRYSVRFQRPIATVRVFDNADKPIKVRRSKEYVRED
jgi:hypothetical protein